MKWILSNMTPLNYIISCQQFSKSVSTDFSSHSFHSFISNIQSQPKILQKKNTTKRAGKKIWLHVFWWHFHSSLLIKERIRFELTNLCSSALYSMFRLCWDLCQSEKQKSWNDPINAPPCRNRQFSDELFKHRHSFPSLFSFISRAGTDVSVAWALLLKTGIFFFQEKNRCSSATLPTPVVKRGPTRTKIMTEPPWKKEGKK